MSHRSVSANFNAKQRRFLDYFQNSYIRAVKLHEVDAFISELCDIFLNKFPVEHWSLRTESDTSSISQTELEHFYMTIQKVRHVLAVEISIQC